MSSGYKSRKAELVAIYRLEFYKKQKNWKLGPDARRETRKKPEKAKKLLNETYNVEKPETDCESLLNKAFVETGTDQNIPSTDHIDAASQTSPNQDRDPQNWSGPVKDQSGPEPQTPKTKKISTAERIRLLNSGNSDSKPDKIYQLWSEAVNISTEVDNWTENELGSQNIWQKPEKGENPGVPAWPNTIWSDAQQIWPQSSRNWPEPVVWDLGYQGGSPRYADVPESNLLTCEKDWPEETKTWMNTAQILQENIWVEELPPEWEKLAVEGVAERLLSDQVLPADQLLRLLLDQPESRPLSPLAAPAQDSSQWLSFLRGAHCVPHSSEVELQLPPEGESVVGDPLASPVPLSLLSGRALHAHAKRCARALGDALRETRIRTKMSQSSLSLDAISPPPGSSSSDERPTRDVGLHGPPDPPGGPRPPLREATYCADAFLAGSHRNDPALDMGDHVPPQPPTEGRGRGRLREGGPVLAVGRGRGRPYVKI